MIILDRRKSHRPARNRAGLFAFLLLFACAAGASQPVAVRIDGDLLTLSAHDAPIRDILAAMVGSCGLSIVSRAALDTRLTTDIERHTLDDLLARVLRDYSYLLQESRSADRSCNGTLWIFSSGEAGTDSFALTPDALQVESLRAKLSDSNTRKRKDAIRDLRKLGTPAVTGPLGDAMSDPDPAIRVTAVQALAHVAHDDVPAVLAAGLTDESARVRLETASALGSLGSEAAVPMLRFALADADSRVRESAIRAFVDIGGPQSAEALSTAIRDPDPALRIEAIEALAGLGGSVAIPYLQGALRDGDAEVRDAAEEALARRSAANP